MRSRVRAMRNGPAATGRKKGMTEAVSITARHASSSSPQTRTLQSRGTSRSARTAAGIVLNAATSGIPAGMFEAMISELDRPSCSTYSAWPRWNVIGTVTSMTMWV